MSDIYDSFVQLGQAFKAKNPALSEMADEEVGQLAAKKYPDRFTVVPPPAPEGAGVMGAVGNVVGQMLGPSSPFGALTRGFNSGATLGASELLMQKLGVYPQGPQPDQGMASTLGEGLGSMIGEIALPYRLLHEALGPVMASRVAGNFPQITRTIGAGLSAGTVEGGKALVQGKEDPLGHLASGLALGAGAEGLTRGAALAATRVAERIIHPKPGGVVQPLVELLTKKEFPVLPADVVKGSNIPWAMENRIVNSQANQQTLLKLHEKLVGGMTRLRDEALMFLGNNAAVLPQTEVGKNLNQAVERTLQQLKTDGSTQYQDLLKTEVGQVLIDPRQRFVRQIQNGPTYETDILTGFKDILGADMMENPTSKAHSAAKKRLYSIYRELVDAHKSQDTNTLVPIPFFRQYGPWETAEGVITKKYAGASSPGYVPPGQNQLAVQERFVFPEKNYQWWWNRNQAIGSMLGEKAVRENPKDYKLVSRVYHLLQDGMDVQAAAKNSNYDTAIKPARAAWELYNTFQEHPLVRDIQKQTEKDPAKVINKVFANAHSIDQAKKILGPEVFDSLRQAWLRDVTWKASRPTTLGPDRIHYVSGWSIENEMKNLGAEGIHSEYLQKLFSDEGFTSPDGKPIQTDTGAEKKFAKFKEMYDLALKNERAIHISNTRKGTGNLQTSSVENVAPALLIQNNQRLRSLIANLLLMGKAGEYYFAPPEENIFLGASIPRMQTGAVPIPFTGRRVPGDVRQGTAAAALTRLFGPVFTENQPPP